MEWAANLTTANWVGLLQVSLFVFIILLGFPMAFTLLAPAFFNNLTTSDS